MNNYYHKHFFGGFGIEQGAVRLGTTLYMVIIVVASMLEHVFTDIQVDHITTLYL